MKTYIHTTDKTHQVRLVAENERESDILRAMGESRRFPAESHGLVNVGTDYAITFLPWRRNDRGGGDMKCLSYLNEEESILT